MTDEKEIDVDEDFIKELIAGKKPSKKETTAPTVEVTKVAPVENDETATEETVGKPEPVEPVKTGKRKNARSVDFEGIFLKEAKIKDRRQMYISGEFCDRITSYLHIISDGKVSMVGYIHNVLAHHMQEYREMINEMYQNKINKSNPL
jgi:hypothetical protein